MPPPQKKTKKKTKKTQAGDRDRRASAQVGGYGSSEKVKSLFLVKRIGFKTTLEEGFKVLLYFQPSMWRTPQFALVAAAARLNAHCPKVAGVHRMTKPKMVAAKRQQI